MLLSHIYEQKILSKEFITKQIGFERKMYSLIAQNCTPSEAQNSQQITPGYHECAKSYKQKIKHFGLMSELLIQQRSKDLKNQINKTCSKLTQEDQILNCVNKATKKIILSNFHQDFQFLDLARQQILKNSTTKIN